MAPRARPLLLRMLLLCLGGLLALALAEGWARARYVAPWYEQLVAEQEREPRSIPRNRYGLRGPDYAYAKPADVRRVLVLGDSFTAGSWVPDDEVFTRLLERRFQAELPLPGIARYEFLNGGKAGTLTEDWLEIYARVAPAFEPDLVLIVFFLRDGTRLAAKSDFMEPIRAEFAQRHERSLAYRSCYLYRFFRDRRDKQEILERYAGRFRDSYFGDEQQSAEWRNAKQNLARLVELARGAGAEVGLVVFPMLVYLEDEPYPFAEIEEAVAAHGRELGLAVHDLLPAFRGRRPEELWLSPLNQHPNQEGHRIAADSLRPFVEELLRSAGPPR